MRNILEKIINDTSNQEFEQTKVCDIFNMHNRWIQLYEIPMCGPNVWYTTQELEEWEELSKDLLNLHRDLGMEWMHPHWLSFKNDLYSHKNETKH